MKSELTEYRGEWFFPKKPEIRFPGTAKLKNGKLILEVECSIKIITELFYPNNRIPIGVPITTDIILGDTFDGDITLFNCRGLISKFSPGPLLVIFYAEISFLGVHFYDKSKIMFRNIRINFKNLDEWVNIHGFELFNEFDNNMHNSFSLKYKIPESILLNENKDYKMYIEFKRYGPTLSRVQKEVCIRQETCVMIEGKNNISLDILLDIVLIFQNFLIIAMMAPTHIVKIEGETDEKIHNFNEASIYAKIPILYNSPEYLIKETELNDFDMLFTIHDIGNEITNCLTNWFKNYNKLKPAYDLYFRALYFYDIYLEEQIINFVVAIEAFHRKMTGRKGKYIFRIKNILEELPSEFRSSCLGDKNDTAEFTKTVVIIRNNLIHQNKSIEDLIPFSEIIKLRRKLIILILTMILANIGLSYDLIYSILEKRRLISS
jgi:hypothetical protein